MADVVASDANAGEPSAKTSMSRGGKRLAGWTTAVVACLPTLAHAHAWSAPYYLPVPLWLYAYAATGTLIISFMMLAFASGTSPRGTAQRAAAHENGLRVPAGVLRAVQLASLLFLALLIISGIAGTQNPFRNLSMSGFWIWFYLGSMYVSALLGDLYAFANPFALLLRTAARYVPSLERGRYRCPSAFATYPALLAYTALIALELFGVGKPRDVSLFLLAYMAYALVGSFCFGRETWLERFDAFGVLCRLCAKLSPCKWRAIEHNAAAITLRNPVAEIAQEKPAHISIVAFLSLMLSSTAYDGLRDTAAWNALFWRNVYPHVVSVFPALGKNYALAGELILTWQWCTFFLMGLVYYYAFRGFCALGAISSRSSPSGKSFAQQFCMALLPIAFFYSLCHYFTLFLVQGKQILSLLVDPLGLGWKVLPVTTAQDSVAQSLINVGYIWHAQVALILVGHIVSVYITHAIAVQRRELAETAIINQLPLLVLTIALTISGLWILSLPLA